jgi:hypothetical protein
MLPNKRLKLAGDKREGVSTLLPGPTGLTLLSYSLICEMHLLP